MTEKYYRKRQKENINALNAYQHHFPSPDVLAKYPLKDRKKPKIQLKIDNNNNNNNNNNDNNDDDWRFRYNN